MGIQSAKSKMWENVQNKWLVSSTTTKNGRNKQKKGSSRNLCIKWDFKNISQIRYIDLIWLIIQKYQGLKGYKTLEIFKHWLNIWWYKRIHAFLKCDNGIVVIYIFRSVFIFWDRYIYRYNVWCLGLYLKYPNLGKLTERDRDKTKLATYWRMSKWGGSGFIILFYFFVCLNFSIVKVFYVKRWLWYIFKFLKQRIKYLWYSK